MIYSVTMYLNVSHTQTLVIFTVELATLLRIVGKLTVENVAVIDRTGLVFTILHMSGPSLKPLITNHVPANN